MDIENLISQYIDGDLSNDAEAEMHHLLSVSSEARALFRAQLALRGVAHDTRVLVTPSNELRRNLFDRLRHEGLPATALPSTISAPSPAPSQVGRSLPSSRLDATALRRRRRAVVWALVPIVLLILIVGGSFVLDRDAPEGMAVLHDEGSNAGLPRAGDLGRQPSLPPATTDAGPTSSVQSSAPSTPLQHRAEGTDSANRMAPVSRDAAQPSSDGRGSRRSRPTEAREDRMMAALSDDVDRVERDPIPSAPPRSVPVASASEGPDDGGARSAESAADRVALALPRHRSTAPTTTRLDGDMLLTPTEPDMIPRIASDETDSVRATMAEHEVADGIDEGGDGGGKGESLINVRGGRALADEMGNRSSPDVSLQASGSMDQSGGAGEASLGTASASSAPRTVDSARAQLTKDGPAVKSTPQLDAARTRDADRRSVATLAKWRSSDRRQTAPGIATTTAAAFVRASSALVRASSTPTMSK